jgi:hypothetical protein
MLSVLGAICTKVKVWAERKFRLEPITQRRCLCSFRFAGKSILSWQTARQCLIAYAKMAERDALTLSSQWICEALTKGGRIMPLVVGHDRLFTVKRAIACWQAELSDEHDVWDLQRELMTELIGQRKVKIIVVVGLDKTEVNEIDAS